jgi:hypothetical protein
LGVAVIAQKKRAVTIETHRGAAMFAGHLAIYRRLAR